MKLKNSCDIKISSYQLLFIFIFLINYSLIAQNNQIIDCNGNPILTEATVRSSNNQQLNLTNCVFSQGRLSEYLNCVKNNNPTLPANESLIVTLTANPAPGISNADLDLLKQEILQKNMISNTCNRVGSDTDLNNKLNTIDLCLLRKHILGLSNVLPEWKFYRSQNLSLTGIGDTADLVFPITGFPLSNLNIIGVHNGNVNQVTTPNDTCVLLCQPSLIITPGQDIVRKPTPEFFLLNKSCSFHNLSLQIINDSGQIIGNEITQNMVGSELKAQLNISNTVQSCTTKLTVYPCEAFVNIDVDQINTTDSTFVDVSVRNAEFIAGYQLSFKFDTTHLMFVRIDKGMEQGFNESNDAHYNGNGHVNISRFNVSSNLGLEEGTRLFRIKFKRKSTTVRNVTIDPENVETLLFDINKNEYCPDITYIKDTNPPICLQDTIMVQGDIKAGYATIQFSDYATDDFGTVYFVGGVNEFDFPVTNIDTLPCGTNMLVYILFRDANGQQNQCIYRVIVDCPDTCSNKFLYFDGVNDRINILNQHNGNVDFTLECWFLSENSNDQGATFHRLFTLGSTERLEIADRQGSLYLFNGTGINTNQNIRDGNWHHLAAVRETDRIKLFLDGNLVQDIFDNVVDLRTLRVGYFDNNNIQPPTLWKGGIDEIKLWNYALSQEEINESKNKINTNKKDCGLIGYWRMEEGIPEGVNQTITEIRDSVGTNHGTLVGFNLTGTTSNFVCNDSIQLLKDNSGCCDDKMPIFQNCPTGLVRFAGSNCNAIVPFSPPVAIDPCNNLEALVGCNRSDNKTLSEPYSLGKTKISCIAIGSNSLRDTCTFEIEVQDTIRPICNGKTLNKIINNNGNASFAAIDLNDNSSDNCGNLTFSASKTFFNCEDVNKTNIVILTVTDQSGNFSSCLVEVKLTDPNDYCGCLNDVTAPTCKTKNITLNLDANGNVMLTPGLINDGSFDVCSDITFEIEGASSFDCNNLGSQIVNLVVTDQANNVSFCTAEVIIQDNLKPSCSISPNFYLNQNGQTIINIDHPNITLNDNCSTVSIISNPPVFNCNSIGSRFFTLTVSDVSGNTNICAQNITIRDTIRPTCTIPPKTFYLQGNGQVIVTQNQLDIASNDNCLGVTAFFNNTNYNCNDIGMKPVSAIVQDDSGNMNTCFNIITIRDTIRPVCGSRTINKIIDENGSVSIIAIELNNNSRDNCGNITFNASKTIFNCEDVDKTNVVTLTVTDNSGNSSSCPAEVIITDPNNYCACINDITAPVCKTKNITVDLDTNGNASITPSMINDGSFDACSDIILQIEGPQSFDCNSIGTQTLNLVVTDFANNVSFCPAAITVRDTIKPICTIQSKTFYLGANGQISVTQNQLSIATTDNCSGSVAAFNPINYTCADLGNTTVSATVRDISGNTNTCSAQIIIRDTITPICVIRDTIVTATDDLGAVVNFSGTALDNCDNPTITYSSPSGQMYPCGEYDIIMTAIDASGNPSTCPFKLTVKDCEGCCLSESSFMTNTDVDFNLSSDLLNADSCIIQFITPKLTDCQTVTEISWGDGTVSRGSFTNAVDFTHQYTEPAIYEVCVTYEEANQQNCFKNKKCNSFEVIDNCTLKRSSGQLDYNKIILVPNPTYGNFAISGGEIFTDYAIYDQLGRKIVAKRKVESTNDISQLQNGVYFVRLTIGSINVTKHIIKIQ